MATLALTEINTINEEEANLIYNTPRRSIVKPQGLNHVHLSAQEKKSHAAELYRKWKNQ
ncbi:hypothetical protein [Bacillus cereus]|uniref:hypothetical protein n=1 Tax=Bacillus cereus TaxID=1396 RepID=UPI0035CD09C2